MKLDGRNQFIALINIIIARGVKRFAQLLAAGI